MADLTSHHNAKTPPAESRLLRMALVRVVLGGGGKMDLQTAAVNAAECERHS